MWSTVTSSRIASRPFPTSEGVSPSRTDADASPVHQGSQPMHAPDQQRPEGMLWGRRAALNLPRDVAEALGTGDPQALAGALVAEGRSRDEWMGMFEHQGVVELLLQNPDVFVGVVTHSDIPLYALGAIFEHQGVVWRSCSKTWIHL